MITVAYNITIQLVNISQQLMKQIGDRGWIVKGKVISLIIFISFFIIVPDFLRFIWPCILKLASTLGKVNLWMYIIIGMSANLTSMIVNNFFMLYVYTSKSPFFQQFRISPNKAWPWQQDSKWKTKLIHTMLMVMFNALVVNSIILYGQSLIHQLRYQYSLQDWPQKHRIFSRFLMFFIYNQIVSYLAHWAFHHPILYKFHKIHHEYKVTISLTATYAHPLEYISSNLLSTAFCIPLLSLFFDVHLIQVFLWIFFRLTQTIEVHSGYDFPWGCLTFLPWKNRSIFHDFHHSHNWGSYGSMLILMDRLMHTDKEFNKYYVQIEQRQTNGKKL